ncbi:glutamate ABC transporter substrate-binding protein [Amycolatopsis sp. CA-230715]|uniref:glutamate ABC transporter substrate-binding protein n=1 Tax=Amycolatopsis sp. CA-230715 TaxID=2745196 RepID=UPI001C022FA2|nr:glutamate ABC transporter substrate-binding protein [Amycolatopsis sp. CA-230715]QWF78992.1 ABC transporter glutamine-binding protein GlnH [Amycolatopsis sp. CA-230715]
MRGARLFLALVLVAVLTACSGAGGSPSDPLVDRAAKTGKLTVGIRFDQPGLSERTVDGRYVGFDVDVAKYVANALGVAPDGITWRETTSATRETDLTSGKVDMVVAAYSITPKREQQVAFAGPYFTTGQDLLVRRSSADITGPDSLNDKRLCSVAGSTPAQQVRDRFAQAVRLVEYPRYPDCVTALLAGQIDAVTTDAVILAGYVAQNPELLRVVGKPFSTERYGVGLRKGDAKTVTAVGDAIRAMIGDGEWRKSLQRTIGASGYPLPPAPEVARK